MTLEKKGGKKERASDQIEMKLIKAILTKEYPTGSTLRPERELAEYYGVGRPTVREALQRLERDGWITVRKGHPAIVNDYWHQGNVMTLVHIIQNHDDVTDEFISYLLELRISLAPVYIRNAVAAHRPKVVALLANLDQLKPDADSYAAFDWELQKNLTRLSPNPIYLLIVNSFDSFYLKMARRYFSIPEHREASWHYYHELLNVSLQGDFIEAERVARKAMEKSLELWRNRTVLEQDK
ncbi:GntR family transcriptional regulator, negative regulator for fad regulon and positive regulator of fabA [Brevibacillus sp. IT-7CA2]|uniref:GntR family transcriptional regulator n=1 Tax=Brevibacillus sp. IT-7CA2 TaxID=3026436 RepID=UPI0039DFF372